MNIFELVLHLLNIWRKHGNLYILLNDSTDYLPTLRHVKVVDETREGMEEVVVLSFSPIK